MTAWRGWSELSVHQATTMPLRHRSRRIIARHIVTLPRLTQANWQVTTEMSRLGFWTTDLDEVGVHLVPASLTYYGWHDGHISIPCVSGAQLIDLWHGYHTRLTDVLRHEWAHAVAHTFPDFIATDRFVRCFGGDHEYPGPVACYDPAHHVTAYAAAMPCEDFAEVFHHYLRHKGRLPVRLAAKKPIVRKWSFIDRMAQRIAAGKFRF